MRIHITKLKACLYAGLALVLLLCCTPLAAQNRALHFDGDNDYINLGPIANFPPGGDFTVEMWFFSTATGGNGSCSGDFRRLFSLGAVGPNRFEVGECNGTLSVFLSGPGIVQSAINVRDNQWHCLSAVRAGAVIDIYLDGSPVPGLTGLAGGSLIATLFRVGHWPGGGNTLGQDWQGWVDEVKLWNTALPAGQLTACGACVLKGDEPGLVAYWRFDQGVAGGPNTGIVTVTDASSGGSNAGALSSSTALTPPGFALQPGQMSNFVASTAPVVYPQYANHSVFLSDPLQSIGLASICDGDPVHFSILDPQGVPTQAGAGATVAWEYSDDCSTWTPAVGITAEPAPSAVFSGFTFVSPPADASTTVINCASNPNGYVDRCYRAIITVTNALGTCRDTAWSVPLRICCPVAATLAVTPPGPLCEGDVVSFTATLTTNLPAPAPTNNVQISWCVIVGSGAPIPLTGPGYDNQSTIVYPATGTLTLGQQNICFKAVVSNCACAPVTVQQCVRVDPKPVCGTITGAASPATLMPDPDGNPDHYLICPFNDAAVEIATPFTNCIPVWQYMFPSVGIWNDLGASNGTQNTNVLPHLKPSGSPYLWPPGETCILYRIKCVSPLPNPGCPPCYSNEVRICLKAAPTPPVITANPNPICKGAFSLMSVQNPAPAGTVDYVWYCNGLVAGFGDFFNASQEACYWVTATDVPACQTSVSNTICLDVCEAVAIISCPVPLCPCQGDPITLSGADSYGTCGGPVTYSWSWIDLNGVLQTAATVSITDVPALAGTTYTLTVTDANGCTDTKMITIVPCAN